MTRPILTRHHWRRAASLDITGFRRAYGEVKGINAKIAVVITHAVSTMACAYLFTLLALVGLPGAIQAGGTAIVQWIAQTFLQLVLLSIIMVGQQVQSAASDARAEKEFADTERIVDALNLDTEGGLKAILDAVEAIADAVTEVRAEISGRGEVE